MGRRTLVGLALLGTLLLTACSNAGTGDGESSPAGLTVAAVGDPNAAGRASAPADASTAPPPLPAMPGGSSAICANETLGESMNRAVDAGSSIVVANGGFTGVVMSGDGEVGVPYSEVSLYVEDTLAGPDVPQSLSGWVTGNLAATGDVAATGETASLWAAGGRMVAIVDNQSDWSGPARAGDPGRAGGR